MGMYKVLARGTKIESCSRYSVNTVDGERRQHSNQDHDKAINWTIMPKMKTDIWKITDMEWYSVHLITRLI